MKSLIQLKTHLKACALYFVMVAFGIMPFIGFRFLRTAGDEKLYVAQALEMAAHGDWIIQWFRGIHEYFKGPFHYVLLRVGLLIFGHSPWAVFYMNFFLIILGSLALAALVRRRLPQFEGAPVFAAIWLTVNVGTYSHIFSSQMEVELVALFSIAFWLLDRAEKSEPAWAFWLVTGLVGWVKSPLHSVFLGVSALILWGLRGELGLRLRQPRSWFALGSGILLCTLGFVPAFLVDREAFLRTYLFRENFGKNGSGQNWMVSIESAFGFYLIPWLLPVLAAYAYLIFGSRKLLREIWFRDILKLTFAFAAPNVLFFLWHPYRFENYNLPIIAAPILLVTALWEPLKRNWNRLYQAVLVSNATMTLILPLFLSLIQYGFHSLPAWWPFWLAPLVWGGCLSTLILNFRLRNSARPRMASLGLSWVGFYISLGATLSVLGEAEIFDLRQFLAKENPTRVIYYDAHGGLFNEWGLLNFWIRPTVYPSHDMDEMAQKLVLGAVVLFPFSPDSSEVGRLSKACVKPKVIPWARWRTHGQSQNHQPLWRDAWEKRDLSILMRPYAILKCDS